MVAIRLIRFDLRGTFQYEIVDSKNATCERGGGLAS